MKCLALIVFPWLTLACSSPGGTSASGHELVSTDRTSQAPIDEYGAGVPNGMYGPDFNTTVCGLLSKAGTGYVLKGLDGKIPISLSLSSDQIARAGALPAPICVAHKHPPDNSPDAPKDIYPRLVDRIDPDQALPYLLYPKMGKSEECASVLESQSLRSEGLVPATMDQGARFKIRLKAREVNRPAKEPCVLMIYTPPRR